ncbi:UBA domain-containing protein [Durusdinium trenchii]|uniref:UBA domain-containing protein n=1 Tax=Durusdinium trenchii TaxID=1381693 RepID=A0ABP0MVY6_9DINO
MSGPSDMESGERKRQYAALGRAVKKSMNPALIQKMRMCSDGERFTMLKAFIANPDLSTVEVEERYRSFAEQKRKDNYETVTLLQLKRMFGKSKSAKQFIATILQGQKGIPHPQAPQCKDATMYKVLRSVLECKVTGTSQETSASWLIAAISGRVKDKESKQIVAQQLQTVADNMPEFDLKTGQLKQKKVPKEKAPEDVAAKNLKTLSSKLPGLFAFFLLCRFMTHHMLG